MKVFLSIIGLVIILSCNEKSKENKIDISNPEKNHIVKAKPLNYPSITIEILNKLYEECTYMDYIFNELDFSISQDNPNSIRASIKFISTSVPSEIPEGCTSMGRKFFHIDGEIVLEAEVYYSPQCAFYVFYENGKAIYANTMTKEGLNFYGNVSNTNKSQLTK